MLTFVFFILGLAVGSFANALSWRLHSGQNWVTGRSQCPKCGHQLAAIDLVPLVSYIALKGRCRYCKKPINRLYIAAEITGGLAFAASYYFWPYSLHGVGQNSLFAGWLIALAGLISLAIYDLRWRLLPSIVLASTLVVATVARIIYIVGAEPNKTHALFSWMLSLAVASGIFWLLYQVSSGRLIGDGDITLGLILGTFLATPAKSFLMIFLASLAGVVVYMPSYLASRGSKNRQLPYGPYLITASFVVMLWGDSIITHYQNIVL